MPVTLTKKATYADYQKLPEGAKYQLIEGEIIEWYNHEKSKMASPTRNHQKIALLIARLIANYLDKNQLGEVLIAPFDVHLNEENCYQPDILFVSNKNLSIIKENNVQGAPDLVIEILSESTEHLDRKVKFLNYEKYGVKEYYLIDPEDNEVIAYDLVEGEFKERYRKKGYIDSIILNKRFDF